MKSEFRAGQGVVLAYNGRRFPGVIELASANGLSLAVVFDGMIGGWVGGAALIATAPSPYETVAQFRTLDGLLVEVYPFGPDDES